MSMRSAVAFWSPAIVHYTLEAIREMLCSNRICGPLNASGDITNQATKRASIYKCLAKSVRIDTRFPLLVCTYRDHMFLFLWHIWDVASTYGTPRWTAASWILIRKPVRLAYVFSRTAWNLGVKHWVSCSHVVRPLIALIITPNMLPFFNAIGISLTQNIRAKTKVLRHPIRDNQFQVIRLL